MARWEQRLHIRCAIEEEKHESEKTRQCLEFMARLLVGAPDEPTKEKPVIETSTMSDRVETRVKKMVDVGYDDRVKKLAEQSMETKRETEAIIEKMRADIAAGKSIIE